MNGYAYTEDQLVAQPTVRLFGELGRQTMVAMEEVLGMGGMQDRETRGGSSCAWVEDAMKNLLAAGLPRAYTPEPHQQRCSTLFEHFCESYPESGAGVYAAAG